jgi:hypothetical protein
MTNQASKPLNNNESHDHDYPSDDSTLKEKKPSEIQIDSFCLKLLAIFLCTNVIFFYVFTRHGEAFEGGNDSPILNEIASDKIVFPNSKSIPTEILPQINTKDTSLLQPQTYTCYVWEFFNDADLKRANIALSNQVWSEFSSELVKAPATFMVFIGPFANKTLVDNAIKALNKLNIKDYTPLPNNEISLSILNTHAAAMDFKQALTKRGLNTVQVKERYSNAQRLRYRFNRLTNDRQQALIQLAGTTGVLRPCESP